MQQSPVFFEKKTLNDPEFPVQIINCSHSEKNWRMVFSREYAVNDYTHLEGGGCFIHWHEHLEMHYALEGTGCVQINQTFHDLAPGDLAIVNPCEIHGDRCNTPPYSYVAIIFEMKDVSKELAEMNVLFRPVIRQDKTIASLFERLHEESLSPLPGSKQVCKALVLDLIVYLIRHYTAQTLNDRESRQRKKDMMRLSAALQHIDRNYHLPLTNADLAEATHMSESRFNHLFRQIVGVPPMKYLIDVRLRKAMNMLTTSHTSVTDVCYSTGFRDYNNFGRLFLKRFGVTPTQVCQKPEDLTGR